MNRYCCLFFIFLIGMPAFAQHSTFLGRVQTVIDGNTLEIIGNDKESQRVSLLGIDSPELGQEFGEEAKRALEKMLLNKDVTVELTGKDRWGNYIAVVKLSKNDLDPRIRLLEAGLAWTAERNPVEEFEAIRVEAMKNKKGLWSNGEPVAPWIYRRQQTMMQAKSY